MLNSSFAWRGFLNVDVLVVLISGLLCLFIFHPVLTFIRNNARNLAIDGDVRINATGQAPVLFQMPELIDKSTPDSAKTRTGFDGLEYDLVFSDEFEVENQTFYPGDDPYWEAVDLWYGATERSKTTLGPPRPFTRPLPKKNITTNCRSYQGSVYHHPGHANNIGRSAPEIDVIETEKNEEGNGQVASQSAQFAPFTHDSLYLNATVDEWTVYNTETTRPNPYLGSAVQQAVSSLTLLPEDMFEGSGQQFHTLGFEYWTDPNNPSEGFITWQSDGQQTARLGATGVGPDTGADGSGVSQRLIPQEPMSIILNLGISANWQTINLTTMEFPAEMLIEYVRVYQRKGETNIGCDPPNFPTAKYIQDHLDTYSNPHLTAFNYPVPVNGLYSGGC